LRPRVRLGRRASRSNADECLHMTAIARAPRQLRAVAHDDELRAQAADVRLKSQ
jgi:hypothetical protein